MSNPVDQSNPETPNPAGAEDQATRASWRGPVRSAYLALIGESPKAGPDDRDTARAYLQRIELALADESANLTHAERHRLIEKRALWSRRAAGRDVRYRLVGTRGGRLPTELEDQIRAEQRRQDADDQLRNPLGCKSRRDKPQRRRGPFATGGPGAGSDLDGSHDDDSEAGETAAPRLRDDVFIIPGSDAKGHSQRVYARLMPYHYRALEEIRNSKVFPFRTSGDIVRWAVVHGLEELQRRRRNGQVESLLLQADAMKEIFLTEQYAAEFDESLRLARQTISMHLANQAHGEARRIIALVWARVLAMPEGYWRGRWEATLQKEYGHLLDSATVEGADLSGGAA